MAGTNVPAPSFGTNGFTSPASSAILAGVQADISAAFSATLNFNLNTPQGQLSSSWAAVISNVYQEFCYFSTQIDPAYASGRWQDAIGNIYFLQRNPAQPTSLQVQCTGLAGVVIPVGSMVQDAAGNLYAATAALTIPSGGSVTGGFACTVPGPVAVPAGALSIYQAIPGWDSATVVSGTQGVNVESRAAFEQRREDAVGGNSFGAIGSIIGAVAQVADVTDYYGYDNSTSNSVVVGGVTIAANSIYICAAGGVAADVAQAIWSKKAPGCGYTGNTTVTVYDDNPLYASPIPYSVSFEVAVQLQLLFAVELVNNAQIPSDASTLIQSALIAAVTQGILPSGPAPVPGLRARIGSVVYATTYIQAINALGSWAQVASIGIGSANTPSAVFTGSINGTTLTVSAVTSGTIAIGQTLADSTGDLQNGTIITAGSGSSWTVNNSQTVASESMTGSTTNQSLVSVNANQEPQLLASNIAVTLT